MMSAAEVSMRSLQIMSPEADVQQLRGDAESLAGVNETRRSARR